MMQRDCVFFVGIRYPKAPTHQWALVISCLQTLIAPSVSFSLESRGVLTSFACPHFDPDSLEKIPTRPPSPDPLHDTSSNLRALQPQDDEEPILSSHPITHRTSSTPSIVLPELGLDRTSPPFSQSIRSAARLSQAVRASPSKPAVAPSLSKPPLAPSPSKPTLAPSLGSFTDTKPPRPPPVEKAKVTDPYGQPPPLILKLGLADELAHIASQSQQPSSSPRPLTPVHAPSFLDFPSTPLEYPSDTPPGLCAFIARFAPSHQSF